MVLRSLTCAIPLITVIALTAGGYVAYGLHSTPSAAPAAPPEARDNGVAPRPRPGDLPGQILVCLYNRFARLGLNLDLAWISQELDNEGFIGQHCLSPDGKSVAFKHQTAVGEVLSIWKFDQAWPGKVVRTNDLIIDFFWMPDGKHLVLSKYQAIKDGLPADFKIQMLDVATRKIDDLNLPEGHWPVDVSRDGNWFLTVKNVDPKKSAVGAQLNRVERSSGKADKLFDGASIITPPKWRISPNGRQVAGLMASDTRRLQVFVGDVQTGTLRDATQEDRGVSNFFGWSPDGRKLLYQLTREPAAPRGGDTYRQIIAIIDANGHNRIELFENKCQYNAQGQRQTVDMIMCADWR